MLRQAEHFPNLVFKALFFMMFKLLLDGCLLNDYRSSRRINGKCVITTKLFSGFSCPEILGRVLTRAVHIPDVVFTSIRSYHIDQIDVLLFIVFAAIVSICSAMNMLIILALFYPAYFKALTSFKTLNKVEVSEKTQF